MENQNQSPTNHQPAAPVAFPRHSNTLVISLSAVIVFGLVLLAGYLFWDNKNLFVNTTQQMQVFPTPTTTENNTVYSNPSGLYTVRGNKLKQIAFHTFGGYGIPTYDEKNQVIYYVTNNVIKQYSLRTKTEKDFYKINETEINTSINNPQFVEPHFLYVTEGEYNNSDNSETPSKLYIREINIQTNAERMIGPIKPVLFGWAEYLFRYNNYDIVASFGGDGCGTWGAIYNAATKAVIATTGGGCSNDPRLLGFRKQTGDLIMVSIIPDPYPDSKYDLLYFQNVTTGTKKTIFDLKTIIDKIESTVVNESKTKVGIITSKEIILINLDTKKIDLKIPIKGISAYRSFLTERTLYAIENNNKISSIDLTSGAITKASWNFNTIGNGPEFLGMWNNNVLLYLYGT